MKKYDLCIIGGAGHVGLPLGVAFARAGVRTVLLDINKQALRTIKSGVFPFKEAGGDEALAEALNRKTLHAATHPSVISESAAILIVIGTPVDEHLHPDFGTLERLVESHFKYFQRGQLLILRSTLYPGTTERIQRYFDKRSKRVSVVFCPERIVQGKSLEELQALPQIIAAFDKTAAVRAEALFQRIARTTIVMRSPIEAELAKLFSNAWRYIKFAVGNQFFMMAQDNDLDYYSIYDAMVQDYPRNADLPRAGFSAGPCLLKDTMQLAAFDNHSFFLGHSAMLVNQGLPSYIMRAAKKRLAVGRSTKKELKNAVVGILGMAFKAESDDGRDSLSYKLRKVAKAEAKAVLCHDPYIKDKTFVDLKTLLAKSDVVILAAPHAAYKRIDPKRFPKKLFVDIWRFWPLVLER